MRKWVLYLDLALLLMCLGLLIVDLQIKNDLVDQMKRMQGVIDGQEGQRSTERDNPDSLVPDILLRGNVDSGTAVESAAIENESSQRAKSRARHPAGTKRDAGNRGAGIQSDGQQVGS